MSSIHLLYLHIFSLTFISHIHSKVHKCNHDQIHPNIDIKKQFINYDNHPFEYDKTFKLKSDSTKISNINQHYKSRRRELQSQPQSIRIKPYYDPSISTENGLTQTQIEYIKSLISTVIRHYENFVSVIPVSDKLSFDRTCIDWIETEFGINCLEYLKPNQCGMVDIPDEHMNENYLYFNPLNSTTAIKLPFGTGMI